MEKEDCCKKQARWYKQIWERIIIFSRWYRRWALWVAIFLVIIYAVFLCKTSYSFIFFVIFQLCMVMTDILLLIAFEPLEDE